mmetsp:Transcript_46137/g.109760  ORF Transcript_46137/g.109760 Transcript_46137/m.109760 type:complete len:200 (+) Transcript_46137:1980-2579(+)
MLWPSQTQCCHRGALEWRRRDFLDRRRCPGADQAACVSKQREVTPRPICEAERVSIPSQAPQWPLLLHLPRVRLSSRPRVLLVIRVMPVAVNLSLLRFSRACTSKRLRLVQLLLRFLDPAATVPMLPLWSLLLPAWRQHLPVSAHQCLDSREDFISNIRCLRPFKQQSFYADVLPAPKAVLHELPHRLLHGPFHSNGDC